MGNGEKRKEWKELTFGSYGLQVLSALWLAVLSGDYGR